MEGFYTRAQASKILKCSNSNISYHIKHGTLRAITKSNTVYIPQEDVIHMYENQDKPPTVMRWEMEQLKKEMESLKAEMNVIKTGIGIRSKRTPWSDDHIRLFYVQTITDLGKVSWETSRIYDFADTLLALSDKELARLIVLQGSNAWLCIHDLASRMMSFLKDHPMFPANGLETLLFRLEGGRDKLCGIIHIALNSNSLIKYQASRALKEHVEKKPLDTFLIHYLTQRRN